MAGNLTRTLRIVISGNGAGAVRTLGSVSGAAHQSQQGIKRLDEQAGRLRGTLSRVGSAVKTAFGTALIAGAGAAIKLGIDFESSMQKINGLVGISQKQVNVWSRQVLDLAKKLPQSPNELAKAMYFVTSAGFRGADAMRVLTASAKAAASGLGDTQVVADAVTSAVNAYGIKNLSAAKSTDILVATVREGKAAAEDLAPVFGRIVPLTSQLGVGFDQVGAALAAMTRIGMSADESATSIQAILSGLLKPSTQGAKALKKVGMSFSGLREEISKKGLFATLMDVRKAFKGNDEELVKVIPNVRALRGFLALTGKQSGETAGIFKRMADTTGATDKAFQSASQTAKFKLQSALSSLQVMGIKFSQKVLPVLADFVSYLADTALPAAMRFGEGIGKMIPVNLIGGAIRGLFGVLKDLVTFFGPLLADIGSLGKTLLSALSPMVRAFSEMLLPALKSVSGFLARNRTLITGLGITIGVFAGILAIANGGLVIMRVQLMLLAIQQRAVAIATRVMTIAQTAWNLVANANPIMLVVAALAALAVGFMYAWRHSETFRNIVKGAFNGVLSIGKAVGAWFSGPFVGFFTRTIPGAFRAVLNWVKSHWPYLLGALAGPIGLAAAAIVKHWAGVRNFFGSAWGSIKRNVVYPIRDFFTKSIPGWANTLRSKVVGAFGNMVNGIKHPWSTLKSILRGPVKYFVDTVYNNGLRKAWNNTAGKIPGVPDLPYARIAFREGGPVTGGVRGRDSVPSLLMPGEHVLTVDEVKALGGQKGVFAFRQNLHKGGRMMATIRGQVAHAALGGWIPIPDPIKNVVGKVGSVLKKGFNWAEDFTRSIASKALATVFTPIRSLINSVVGHFPQAGMMGTAIKQIANTGLDKMLSWVKGKAAEDIPGGKTAAAALKWVKTQRGKPYRWGAAGPNGYDCSGLMGTIENVLRGEKNPFHRRWSTAAFTGTLAPPGWVRSLRSGFEVGITNAGVGHTAGTLAGVNVESSGGVGVRVGGSARGAHNGMFPSWYGFKALKYDAGGLLAPGTSLVANQTGRWETVLPPEANTPIEVTVIVQGDVIAEKDFIQRVTPAIRDAILKANSRNAGRFMRTP